MAIEGDRFSAGFFSPGDVLSASSLSDLAGNASRAKQVYSSNAEFVQGTFGTISMGVSGSAQAEISYDFPFKVTVGYGDTAGTFKVYVRAGTVNSWITKIFGGPDNGKYLDATPTPHLPLDSASGDTKYVILRCHKDSGSKFFPTSTDVYLADDMESVVDSNEDGHLLLASISLKKEGSTIKSAKVNQYIYSAQSVIRIKPGSETALWTWTSR